MIDYAKITIKAGDGGNGIVSFRHEKYVPKGGPDGGNGGEGGDVYFEATTELQDLEPFRFLKVYKADDGGRGGNKKKKGADGEDLIVQVAVGSVLKIENIIRSEKMKKELGQWTNSKPTTIDFTKVGQIILIARGGKGGRGNYHFRSSTNRVPMQSEDGIPGEQIEATLELKTLAQIGLVGLPNAGKSTLLNAITNAHSRVGEYPFTTLEPILGVMEIGKKRIVIADIPGLISGAAAGKGLGVQFLRHIERTKLILHLISIESDTLNEDFDLINEEIGLYKKQLAKKKQLVVVNKMDLASPDKINSVAKMFKKKGVEPVFVSSLEKRGLDTLQAKISDLLK